MLNEYLVIKKQLFEVTPDNRNKHLSRDPEMASSTRNCQIYSLQLQTLKKHFNKFV